MAESWLTHGSSVTRVARLQQDIVSTWQRSWPRSRVVELPSRGVSQRNHCDLVSRSQYLRLKLVRKQIYHRFLPASSSQVSSGISQKPSFFYTDAKFCPFQFHIHCRFLFLPIEVQWVLKLLITEAPPLSMKLSVLHYLALICPASSSAAPAHSFPGTLEARTISHSVPSGGLLRCNILSSSREKTRSYSSFIFISHCPVQSPIQRKCSPKMYLFIHSV